MFVYGVDDPWQGAELTQFPDPKYAEENRLDIIVADCDTCAHCVDLDWYMESNPEGLKKAQNKIKANLRNWLLELDGKQAAELEVKFLNN